MTRSEFTLDTFQSMLKPETKTFFSIIEYVSEVTSTNDYLLNKATSSQHNSICFAGKQTHGRGQRGNEWVSNDSDLTFSLLWRTNREMNALAGCSLIIAIAIAESLNYEFPQCDFKVKWPNDIMLNNKKVAGILIETTRIKDVNNVVIGIGINLENDERKQSLHKSCTVIPNANSAHQRQQIAASIINSVRLTILRFEIEGLKSFQSHWDQLDVFHQQSIIVNTHQGQIKGLNKGINEKGELTVELPTLEYEYIHSGQIQL